MSIADTTTSSSSTSSPTAPAGDARAVRYTLAEQGSPWIFVVAERSAVAIKAPSEPDVVEGLWALMRSGEARADELAAVIPEFSGERRTAFAVVGDDEPNAVSGTDDGAESFTVIAHGRAAVDALSASDAQRAGRASSGWKRIEADGDAPWAREVLTGSRKFALGDLAQEVGADAVGVSFPLDAGVVVANRLDVALAGASLEATAEPEAVEAAEVEHEREPEPLEAEPEAEPAHDAPDETTRIQPLGQSRGVEDDVFSEETILTRRPAPAAEPRVLDVSDQAGGMDGAPLTKAPGVAASIEAETETVIRPRRSVVPRLADDSLLQHDGETVLRPDIARPVEDETVFRHVPFVPDDPQTVMYGFRVNGGQAYPLDAVHYFGRNPRQPRIPLPDPSRLVPVVSSTKSVSATHLEIKQVGDSIVATDLKSTNGTSVNLPHKHWQRLRQGESIVVVPGTLIDIGDGNVIEILPPWRGE
ncbi:hypothetical protein ALI44B_14430 [Leifsonia sp. ALI-44-B]|uniref:FHA domain-containing protein n=1 Tax=Leifsonia sp. ALI-44-B TaxID=1933776 RepID=UPI00097BD31C|nr:FHA domain-containing protein [Leifsonia sp. ALI-44-B]ONI61580.1 hypothetical protein ALI44B_14430 [Leifsonia sp. ALI-44-B]